MIDFLITLLVFLVVLYVVRLIVGELGLPATITKILYLIVGLVALFWLLSFFGLWSGFPIR